MNHPNGHRRRIKAMSAHLKSLARRTNPARIPLFPLKGTVLLPGCELPLNIFEPRYLNMFDDALSSDRLIGIIQPAIKTVPNTDMGTDARKNKTASQQGLDLCTVGTLGRINQYSESKDGRYLVSVTGLKRFTLTRTADVTTPYRQGLISYQGYESDPDIFTSRSLPQAITEKSAERTKFIIAMKAFAKTLNIDIDWEALKSVHIDQIVDQCAMIGPFGPADKQSLLEAKTAESRRHLIIRLMELYCVNNTQNGRHDSRKS